MEEKNEKAVTAIKAIRLKCLDCCCGSAYEVEMCPVKGCPLYEYRFGKNPRHKGRTFTEEQKAANAERLRLWRESQREKNKNVEGI